MILIRTEIIVIKVIVIAIIVIAAVIIVLVEAVFMITIRNDSNNSTYIVKIIIVNPILGLRPFGSRSVERCGTIRGPNEAALEEALSGFRVRGLGFSFRVSKFRVRGLRF